MTKYEVGQRFAVVHALEVEKVVILGQQDGKIWWKQILGWPFGCLGYEAIETIEQFENRLPVLIKSRMRVRPMTPKCYPDKFEALAVQIEK